jgi:hypothetical protein
MDFIVKNAALKILMAAHRAAIVLNYKAIDKLNNTENV